MSRPPPVPARQFSSVSKQKKVFENDKTENNSEKPKNRPEIPPKSIDDSPRAQLQKTKFMPEKFEASSQSENKKNVQKPLPGKLKSIAGLEALIPQDCGQDSRNKKNTQLQPSAQSSTVSSQANRFSQKNVPTQTPNVQPLSAMKSRFSDRLPQEFSQNSAFENRDFQPLNIQSEPKKLTPLPQLNRPLPEPKDLPPPPPLPEPKELPPPPLSRPLPEPKNLPPPPISKSFPEPKNLPPPPPFNRPLPEPKNLPQSSLSIRLSPENKNSPPPSPISRALGNPKDISSSSQNLPGTTADCLSFERSVPQPPQGLPSPTTPLNRSETLSGSRRRIPPPPVQETHEIPKFSMCERQESKTIDPRFKFSTDIPHPEKFSNKPKVYPSSKRLKLNQFNNEEGLSKDVGMSPPPPPPPQPPNR